MMRTLPPGEPEKPDGSGTLGALGLAAGGDSSCATHPGIVGLLDDILTVPASAVVIVGATEEMSSLCGDVVVILRRCDAGWLTGQGEGSTPLRLVATPPIDKPAGRPAPFPESWRKRRWRQLQSTWIPNRTASSTTTTIRRNSLRLCNPHRTTIIDLPAWLVCWLGCTCIALPSPPLH